MPNGKAKESYNAHGELTIDKEINVLDIAASNCCSMVLYEDGTVQVCGHAGYGIIGLGIDGNDLYCRYAERTKYKRYVPAHGLNCGSIRNPNPNANIVAIALDESGYAVLYKDGTLKAETFINPVKTLTGYYPDAKAIRLYAAYRYKYLSDIRKYGFVPYIGVQILKEDDSIETIGDSGSYGEWGYRLENKRPTVTLTGDPVVNKTNNTLTFKVKVVDPPDRQDSTIPTEIELNYGDAFIPVKNFKANNTTITDGTLSANNGSEYTITVNNFNTLIPDDVSGFTLRVIATDGFGTRGGKAVNIGVVGGGSGSDTTVLAQWPLDSDKDKKAQDSSGNGNEGTINGATITTGIISNALKFDGVDDYVSVRSSFNNQANWTFEAWIKPEAPGIIYSEGNPAATLQIAMGNDNSISVGTWHQDRAGNWQWFSSEANALKRNTWNHLVVTLSNGGVAANSGYVYCYVNGNLVKSGRLGCEYHASTKDAMLGGNIGVKNGQALTPFGGCIDEVTLYNQVLTAEQIKQNYEKIVFLDNIELTNAHNDETVAPCTFGSHINKLEFDLRKTVNKLVFELDMPSNMKLVQLKKINIWDSVNKQNKEIAITNATVNNNVISIQQPLAAGHYTLELLIYIDDRLVVKTKSYYDDKEIKTNLESNEFEFQFMDFGSLPDLM